VRGLPAISVPYADETATPAEADPRHSEVLPAARIRSSALHWRKSSIRLRTPQTRNPADIRSMTRITDRATRARRTGDAALATPHPQAFGSTAYPPGAIRTVRRSWGHRHAARGCWGQRSARVWGHPGASRRGLSGIWLHCADSEGGQRSTVFPCTGAHPSFSPKDVEFST